MTNSELIDGVCLAHAVRGVSLVLTTRSDAEVIVSTNSLDADLTPCQLRHALLAPQMERELRQGIAAIEVRSGAVHLGGGIYQPSHPIDSAQRWFVTTLDSETVARRLTAADDGQVADDRFGVTLRADPALGRTVVCVESVDGEHDLAVDEIAARSVAACLVEELIADVADVRSPR